MTPTVIDRTLFPPAPRLTLAKLPPSTPAENSSPYSEPARWILLLLLLISILINYIDRGALSIAVPAMESDFSLTGSQKGLLLSAFFWSYALLQLPAGWLVDRYDVKWVYAGGYLLWTVATAMTGFVTGFAALIAARLLLGIGESVAYPAISRLLVENFREEQRGIANSLIDAASKIGPAFSILAGGLLVDRFGWRMLFITLGVGGVVWLLPWYRWAPSRPHPPDPSIEIAMANRRPSIWEVLRHRSVWGTSLGMFSLGYVWYFLLTWLPSYLVDVHNFNLQQTAFLAALPFLAMAIATVLSGWGADHLIAAGKSPTVIRKGIALGGFLLAAFLMVAVSQTESSTMCVVLLVAACSALGMFTANVWAMTQTMAGPAAGRWTGIQNCVGNMGGVVSPMIAGWSVQQTDSYETAFYVAALVMLMGIGAYIIFVGPIQPVAWKRTR